jgi:hypothetical protein
MNAHESTPASSLEAILAADEWARRRAILEISRAAETAKTTAANK